MELLDNLAEVGLTTRILQFIIIASVAILFVGIFWRFIVIGGGILFCVIILAMPTKASMQKITTPVYSADIAPAEFIEDCIRYNNGATKESCQKDWKEQGNGKE